MTSGVSLPSIIVSAQSVSSCNNVLTTAPNHVQGTFINTMKSALKNTSQTFTVT